MTRKGRAEGPAAEREIDPVAAMACAGAVR